MFIISASWLIAINAMARPCATALTWNTRRSPKSLPSFAPSMTNAATASEYRTRAVETAVAGAFSSCTMGPSETGSAFTLMPICSCAITMMTRGSQDAASPAFPTEMDLSVITITPCAAPRVSPSGP